VSNAKKISGVMAAGRWLPRAELDASLEEIAQRWMGQVDRFAGAAPLVRPGTAEHRARSSWNGVSAGEERFSVAAAATGDVLLGAQSVTDGDVPGENDARWHEALDGAGRLRSVRLRVANHAIAVEASLEVNGVRSAGKVHGLAPMRRRALRVVKPSSVDYRHGMVAHDEHRAAAVPTALVPPEYSICAKGLEPRGVARIAFGGC
jgi:hypothetical protein